MRIGIGIGIGIDISIGISIDIGTCIGIGHRGGRLLHAGTECQIRTTSHAAATGTAGWQIILIAAGAVLVVAAVTIVLARARAGQRAVPSPAA